MTEEIIRRARWVDAPRGVELRAAAGDGGAVLATIDTSYQWRYRAKLPGGAEVAGWPLKPVQRAVRLMLRAAAQTHPQEKADET